MKRSSVMVGTAGWSIPRTLADEFTGEGSHLRRYSHVMSCAEINTSFYRDHSFATYRKWAAVTPVGFRFSVKVPQLITHDQRLRRARAPLRNFLAQVRGLGKKLGPLLVQLPPSMEFDVRVARTFLEVLREEHHGAVVCEPRHASWFEPRAEAMLIAYRVGRVATDPTRMEAARAPGGWMNSPGRDCGPVAYYRLHGSPRKYWSRYEPQQIRRWAEEMASLSRVTRVWCIFDNTASGAALANAMELGAMLGTDAPRRTAASAK
jgi:uncharacterized protein YecE (DUF72 family)